MSFFLEDEFGNYKYYTFSINCAFKMIQPLIQQYSPPKYFLFLLLEHFIKIDNFPLNNKNICKFLKIAIQSFYNYEKEFIEDGIFNKNNNSELRFSFGDKYFEIYEKEKQYYSKINSIFDHGPYVDDFPILYTLLRDLSKLDYLIYLIIIEGSYYVGRNTLNNQVKRFFNVSSRKVDYSLKKLTEKKLITIIKPTAIGESRFTEISYDNNTTFIKNYINRENKFQKKLIDDTTSKKIKYGKKTP